jgi:hypothetical protein
MNRDDIIRMAREAGLQEYLMRVYRAEEGIHHFAALVRADEREACAKVCDARYMGDNNREDMEARRCAEAIRARGQE